MKNLTSLFATIVTCALIFGCTSGDHKVKLELKYKEGQHLTYQQTAKRTTKVYMADSLVEETMSSYVVDLYEEVNAVDEEGVAEIFERAVWQFDEPAKDDTTESAKMTRERKMTSWIRPNGKIVDVRFAEDENPTSMAYIRNYLEQGMPEYPSVDVSPGKDWTQTKTLMLPGSPMEASTTYRVKSLAREAGYDCAVVEFEGNLVIPIEINPDDSTHRSGVDKIATTGIIYFAYTEGLVVLQRERWVIDGQRNFIKDGQEKSSTIKAEIDVDFVLKKNEMAR